ncbi:MAG: 16S rRNA (guanine(527)-N(7))-methyltransferase RsmG [Thermodesulfobacteriota bacterium]
MADSRDPDLLARGLDRAGILLPATAVERLHRYLDELHRWNRTVNLVGDAPAEVIIDRHFLDSLALLDLIDEQPGTVSLLDIGTGAGFPGLVLKAARPGLGLALVEPRQKRTAFLRHVIRCLALSGVTVHTLHLRGDVPAQLAAVGRHRLVVSRALADTGSFLSLAAPFCADDGLAICMKGGAGAPAELAALERLPLPFHLERTLTYTLPLGGDGRSLLLFRRRPRLEKG